VLRHRPISAPDQNGQGGFTLLEVLVAFVVLAFTMTAIYGLFSNGLHAADQGGSAIVATALAQSKLEAAGVADPLTIGESSGKFANGYRWRRTVRPYRGDMALARYEVAVPFDIEVTVFWPGTGTEKSVTLSTVRLQAGTSRRAP
jgi:general secretion pathway protein I